MKSYFSTIFFIFWFSLQSLYGQDTSIPDSNFEQALIDLGIDSDGTINGKVLTDDISSIVDLNIFNKGIESLSGIEDFISLEKLNCANNLLSILDINSNLELRELNCSTNLLTYLDVSMNEKLEHLWIQNNILSSLDLLSNIALLELDASNNRISDLDVSNNNMLEILKVSDNRLTSLSITNNTQLLDLICSNNQIEALDVSNSIYLRNLVASSNQLPSINLLANDSLRILDVGRNQLNGLSLTANKFLENLTCANNQLSSLNLINNDSLVAVGASNNQLTVLDVSTNLKLQNLAVASNQISAIDLSANVNLESLDLSNNLLTVLDLSLMNTVECQDPDNPNELCQTKSATINVSKNKLSTLMLSNGFNDFITSLNAINNPDLYCIEVDDPLMANAADGWFKDDIAFYSSSCSEVTYIPDDNFEQALIELGYDSGDLDDFVSTAVIAGVTALDISGKNIVDLTGIEDLTALEDLNCSNNTLSNLDLGDNSSLKTLTANNNILTSLNTSNLVALDSLNVSNNVLTTINLSTNTVLRSLEIENNQLTKLDVGGLGLLENLNCNSNQITFIDVNQNSALTELYCTANDLRILNIKNGTNSNLVVFHAIDNPSLTCIQADVETTPANVDWQYAPAVLSLSCNTTYIPDANFETYLETHDLDGTVVNVGDMSSLGDGTNGNGLVFTSQIESVINLDVSGLGINDLTGIEDFTALEILDCSTNGLTQLDLSNNTALTQLYCNINPLLYNLNIKNGQNGLLTNLDATFNPSLYCISVDDPDAANMAMGWFKDEQASYNLDCSQRVTYVPDDNFEQALIDLGYDTGPLDDFVPKAKVEIILNLDVSEKGIKDLTGIEDFVNLISLDCFSNYLTILNLSNNGKLLKLNCGDNSLTGLDLSSNTALTELRCDSNQLNVLDASFLSFLTILDCSSNHISSSDLIITSDLLQLYCAKNNLTSLDLSPFSNLKTLNCADNYISSLDLSANPLLENLTCSDNLLGTLDVTQNLNLLDVTCDSNDIENLNLNTNSALLSLNCSSNNLSVIDLSNCTALISLNIASNNLNALNISQNVDLEVLDLSKNNLSSNGINLLNNVNLKVLQMVNNQLSDLNIENNTLLEIINVSNNSLQTLDVTNHAEISNLNVSNNALSNLNLSAIDALVQLNIGQNQFIELDLNTLVFLERLNCSGNDLLSLKVANGNNSNLQEFNALNNPDLMCIEIDNENEIGENWIKDDGTSYSANCHYNDTYVPDDNFELFLMPYDDTPNDDYVPTANIQALTALDVSGQGISDLTGIEDFISLQTLDVSSNSIDSLNVSFNEALTSLSFSDNVLSSNPDLGNNPGLTTLIGNNTGLTALDLSNNTNIIDLELASNQLMELDLNNMSNLSILLINDNQLVDLDLSNNPALTNLNCASNQLLTLNIQNGNNESLTNLDATNNPDLSCIQADTDSVPTGVNWQIDDGASLSVDCHYYETFVPDDGFETALINLGFDSGDLDDYVPTPKIFGTTNLNVSNSGIKDFTGIEDFENLISLNCSSNQLTDIDLSNNPRIENLNCSSNLLTSIDLSVLPNLKTLDLSDNALVTIDVNSNSSLYSLKIGSNDLTYLDVTSNNNLTTLDCSYNALELSLDLSQNTQLAFVHVDHNQLNSIDIQNGNNPNINSFQAENNPNLTCVLVDDLDIDFSNWSIDPWTAFKLFCDDTDNDGVVDNEDLCPNTPFGDDVDLFGCSFFALPSNNFTISTTGETCISSNNGKVEISAVAIYNYTATLSGDNYFNTFNFTNGVNILNLKAGTYELCITVENQPDYNNCYTVLITEPEPLIVSEIVNLAFETVSFEFSGGQSYEVNINGLVFNTTENKITLNLKSGINTINVQTELECQGVYTKRINLSNDLYVYPNPFENNLNILDTYSDSTKVEINIYSETGQLVFFKPIYEEDGLFSINLGSLNSGIYFVSLKSDMEIKAFKIVKR